LQGPDTLNASLPEQERHTGARGFVWSSTVEDYVAVARQLVVLLQAFRVQVQRARNCFRIRLKIHGMPKIDDNQIFPRIDLPLQLIDADPRDAQLT
jgi:hypothetical protein